jgi:hypothetical protein
VAGTFVVPKILLRGAFARTPVPPGNREVRPIVATRKQAWTDEENEQLKTLVARDVSIMRAAVRFKRSQANVRNHGRRLGTPFPTMSNFRKKFADNSSGI